MSGECDKCHEHTLDCKCKGLIMNDEQIEAFLIHIKEYSKESGIKTTEMISGLTYCLPMMMALCGYEEKIFDGICDLMKQTYMDLKK